MMPAGLTGRAGALRRAAAVLAGCLAAMAGLMRPADAVSSISGTLTADNAFFLYLSTSDSTRGSLIASANNWNTAVTLSSVALLTRGVNYLHLVLVNYGGPYGFLGTFHLSGTGAHFANGLTTLSTDTTNWRTAFLSTNATATEQAWTTTPSSTASVTVTGGSAPYTPGVSPWGKPASLASVDSTALWIGDPNTPYTTNNGNFTIAYSAALVPEPASLALLGTALLAGGALAGRMRGRRYRAARPWVRTRRA